jgi:hypothetical protein
LPREISQRSFAIILKNFQPRVSGRNSLSRTLQSLAHFESVPVGYDEHVLAGSNGHADPYGVPSALV